MTLEETQPVDTTLHVLRRGGFAAEHLAGPRRLYVSPNLGRMWRVIRGWSGPVAAWGDSAMRLAAFAKPSKAVGVAPPGGPDKLLALRWVECHTPQAAARAKALGYAPGAIRECRPVLEVPAVPAEPKRTALWVLVAPMPGRSDRLRSAVLAAAVARFGGREVTLVSSGIGPITTVMGRLAAQLNQPDAWRATSISFAECVGRCDLYLHIATSLTDPLAWRTAKAAGLPTINAAKWSQRQITQRLVRMADGRRDQRDQRDSSLNAPTTGNLPQSGRA